MVEGSQQKALGSLLVLACCQLSQAWGAAGGGKDEAQRKLPINRGTWDRNAGEGEAPRRPASAAFWESKAPKEAEQLLLLLQRAPELFS